MNVVVSTRAFGLVVLALAGATLGCSRGDDLDEARTAHHRLDIRDLTFETPQTDVRPGDTLTWTNRDVVPHTVTATDGSWDSGEIPAQGSFMMVAGGTGATAFACRYHPTMTGTLVVRP